MIVSNLLFDGLLFGALLVALLLDTLVLSFPGLYSMPGVPVLHGAATFVVIGAAIYLAAEDLCGALARRKIWSQESLATALALCAQGFIYYWWRNDSDLMAVVLHIGLMMASLMVLIAVVAAIGAAWHDKSAAPLAGLFITAIGAALLGVLAGVLTFFLSSNLPLPMKIALIVIGVVGWKVRETMKPPTHRAPAHHAESDAVNGAANSASENTPHIQNAHEHSPARKFLAPQRGTLLDRLLPVLVIGALAFVALQSAFAIR